MGHGHKHVWPALVPLGAMCFIGACTKAEPHYDIVPAYEALIFSEEGNYPVGAQYYNGEPAQLKADLLTSDILLCREGEAAEVCVAGVAEELLGPDTRWWLAPDGIAWALCPDTIICLNPDGSEKYRIHTDLIPGGICEGASGTVVVVLTDPKKYISGLAALDTETGTLGEVNWQKTFISAIGKGQEEEVLAVDEEGVYGYRFGDKKKNIYMEWAGSSYEPERVQAVNFLTSDRIALYTGQPDKPMEVTLVKWNSEESGKNVLTLQSYSLDQKLKELVVRFNQESDDYYIQVKENGVARTSTYQDYLRYLQKVRLEISAGHGADIYDSTLIGDIPELLDKGAIKELSDRIEKEGLQREAYFPQTFHMFGREDGVYGIPYAIVLSTICIDEKILPQGEEYNAETLLRGLEECQEEKVLLKTISSSGFWDIFLENSEDLGGLIDWETITCDFYDPRFMRLLKTAGRYGDEDNKEGIPYIMIRADLSPYMVYAEYDNLTRNTDWNFAGWPVEEGGVNEAALMGFCMNAASPYQDGVWEFMMFLLREENQYDLCVSDPHSSGYPVSRGAFRRAGEFFVEETQREADKYELAEFNMSMAPGIELAADKVTGEQVSRIEALLDAGQQAPWKTKPILEIIKEESEAYFDGSKTAEEVIEILQNRVQLYLDEAG